MNDKGQAGTEYQTGGWRAHWVLIITTLLCVMYIMDRLVFAVVVQPMKLELGLSDSEIGIVMTVFTIAVSLLAFPVSYVVDIWSRKGSISIMAIMWSIFTFVTGLAKNFPGVLIPRTLVAGGEAAFTAAGTAMVTAAYPKEKHGRVLGIFNTAFPVGAALGMVVGGLLSVKYGWRMPFFLFAVPGVILGIAVLFVKDYKTVPTLDSSGNKASFIQCIGTLLRIPTVRWYLVGYGMLLIVGNAVTSWFPAFIMREINVKEDVAGSITAVVAIMAIVGTFGGGLLSDFWQRRNRRSRLLLPMITAAAAGAFFIASVLLLKVNFPLFMVVFILFAISYYLGVPALATVSQEVVPASLKGTSYGLMLFGMYFLGGGWSPWVIGAMSDAIGDNGLKIALALSGIGGFIAAFLFFMGSRHYIQDMDNVKTTVLECAT